MRAGLLSEEGYFKMLGKTVGAVLRGSGRTKQSVADSSFDAWGKYYRQDENSPNAIVSYYAKGSLIGLGLDLTIRAKTNGKRSLDDIMRALWQKFGRDFYNGKPRGVTPEEVEALFDNVAGFKLKTFFDKYIRGTEDVPLAKLLPQFGVGYKDERKASKPGLDVNLGREGTDCKLSAVHDGGAAQKAGLSANDLLVAIDGLRVSGNPSNVDGLLSRYKVGETVQVHAFRRDELMAFDVVLQGDRVPGITIAVEQQKTSLRRPTA